MKQLENNYLLPASLLFCLEDGGGRLHLSVETDLLNYSVLHYRWPQTSWWWWWLLWLHCWQQWQE